MKVLVVGATGLIGEAVATRLEALGNSVVRASRSTGLDMNKATAPADWHTFLNGAEAVVNCAGVLQDSLRENTAKVHAESASALFRACEERGIRRVVHFSAVGVERDQPSEFSASKLAGDAALMACDLDWVILRPSVVLGRPVFGASALIRGLAALPVRLSMPDSGLLQVVRLADVVDTVTFFISTSAPRQVVVELAGPEPLPMDDIVASYRRWLGWRPAPRVEVPLLLSSLLYRLGDLASWLGWRPPVRSNAAKELSRGAVGDPEPWCELTGIRPTSLDAALREEPATIQEKWFAKLYILKPAIFAVLAAFWITTAIVSATVGFDQGVHLMVAGGAGNFSVPSVILGALADLVIGSLIAYRGTTRWGLWGGIALSAFYICAGTIVRPDLWTEPLGPFLKVFPIAVLHFVALAVLEER